MSNTEYAITDSDGTVRIRGTISPAPGGSVPGTPVWKDLGVISVGDVDTDMLTLYTPGAGEFVTEIRLLGFTYLDADFALGIFSGERMGPVACVMNDAEGTKDSIATGILGIGQIAEGAAIDATGSKIALTALDDPLILALTVHDSGHAPAGPWTANTPVLGSPGAITSNVIAAGHLWNADTAGTTGGSAPDFAGNIGGTVVDNDTSWTDSGALPTIGEARVLICTTTPTAP